VNQPDRRPENLPQGYLWDFYLLTTLDYLNISKTYSRLAQIKKEVKMRLLLSDSVVKKLSCEKRASWQDQEVSGLSIRVTPKGIKTWEIFRRVNGTPTRLTLGRFPDLSTEDARALALEHLSNMALQKTKAGRQILSNKMTFRQAWVKYLDDYAKLETETWSETEKLYNRCLLPLERLKLTEITTNLLTELRNKIATDRGKSTANHAISLTKTIYNRMEAIEEYNGSNPAKRVKLFTIPPRKRFLSHEELGRFKEALDKEKNELATDFLRMVMLTASRRTPVELMEWPEIDYKTKTWNIPAQKMKNKEAASIPLVGDAWPIIERRLAKKTNNYVFPGRYNRGHIAGAQHCLYRCLKAASITDPVSIHDLRRSNASWQAGKNVSLHIIGKTLHHKTPSSTHIYAQVDHEPIRQALEQAADFYRSA
jgi:site-specific recombinase XerD